MQQNRELSRARCASARATSYRVFLTAVAFTRTG
jgi:hypothetical protein